MQAKKSRVTDTFNRRGAAEHHFPDRLSCLMVPVRKGERGEPTRDKKNQCAKGVRRLDELARCWRVFQTGFIQGAVVIINSGSINTYMWAT